LSVGVWERFDRYDEVLSEIKEASSDALQSIDNLDETLTNTSQAFEDRVVKAMDTTSAYLKEQFEGEAGILDLLLFLSSSDSYIRMEPRLNEVVHNLAQLSIRVENRDMLLARGYAIGSKLDYLNESFQRESRADRATLKLTETTILDELRGLASSKDIEAFYASSDRKQGVSKKILDALQSHFDRAQNASSSDLKAFQSYFKTYSLAVEKTIINEFQAQLKDSRNACSSDFKSFQRFLEQSLEQQFKSYVTGISKSWTQASGPLSETLNAMLHTKIETYATNMLEQWQEASQPFSGTAILITPAQVS
jgi:uncharacterized protein YicC (UPF0701 family)